MRNYLNRKGQFNIIEGIIFTVLGIVILGLILVYGSDITQSERDNFNIKQTIIINNKSIPFSSAIGTVPNGGASGASNLIVNSINNFTNNSILSNNYVVNENFTIFLKAGASQVSAQGPNPILNVSYNFQADSLTAPVNTSQDALTSISAISERTDTLGTIIIVGGIITVLLGVFGGLLLKKFRG